MWLIVGLGNPGAKYAMTRHNIGFMALDYLHQSLKAPEGRGDFKAIVRKFKWDGREVVTAQPQTFMNLSGESVRAIMDFYKIDIENLLIVHDEIDIPFGEIRVHVNRSHGGHNGIKSVMEHLNTKNYMRLRLGIGRPADPRIAVPDFVLQKFSNEELLTLPDFLNKAVDAIETIVFEGPVKAAARFN